MKNYTMELIETINNIYASTEDTLELDYVEVEKNNVTLSGMVVSGGDLKNVKPTIYVTDVRPVEYWLDEIENAYNSALDMDFDTDFLTKETILANVIPNVVSNTNTAMEENFVFRRYLDFDIFYRCIISSNRVATSSLLVTKSLAEKLDITEEELFDASLVNSESNYNITDLFSEIKDMLDMEELPSDMGSTTLVLTNYENSHGANTLLNTYALNEALDMLRTDSIYILPSSIHEVLCLDNSHDVNYLKSMVQEVNDTQVADTDRLTYSVYSYSKADGLQIAC